MAEFSFGQVEAVLAAANAIADHKRVAFAGRLKFLQKNGVPRRDRPGRGKSGSYSFGQLLQLAIAVELVQAGLAPQRSAQIVTHNWEYLLGQVSAAIADEEATLENASSRAPRSWVWGINIEGLKDLTSRGANEFDDYDAVFAPSASSLYLAFDSNTPAAPRERIIIVHGSRLVHEIVFLVMERFKFATMPELVDDLSLEIDIFVPIQNAALERINQARSEVISEGLAIQIQNCFDEELNAADFSEPKELAIVLPDARKILRGITYGARVLLHDWSVSWGTSGLQIDEKSTGNELLELARFGVLTAKGNALELTPLGRAVLRLAWLRRLDKSNGT